MIDSGGSDALWLFENSKENIKTPINYFNDILSLTELENPKSNLASEIITSDGKVIGKYFKQKIIIGSVVLYAVNLTIHLLNKTLVHYDYPL